MVIDLKKCVSELRGIVDAVFPPLGLDPTKLKTKAWVRYDEDGEVYFPVIGVRYEGVPIQNYIQPEEDEDEN